MKYAKMLDGRYALILGNAGNLAGPDAANAGNLAGPDAANAGNLTGHGSAGACSRSGLGSRSDVSAAIARAFAQHGASVAYANLGAGNLASPGTADFGIGDPHGCGSITAFNCNMAPSAMDGLCESVLGIFPYVDLIVSAVGYYPDCVAGDRPMGSSAAGKPPVGNSAASKSQADSMAAGKTHMDSLMAGWLAASDLRKMLDANLGCAVRCFQLLLPGMLERRRGELIMLAPNAGASPMSSVADMTCVSPMSSVADMTCANAMSPNNGMPCASPMSSVAAMTCAGAITSFVRNVTNDYIRYRVRANAILCPFGAPDCGAADAALWCASYMSRFVVGETLKIK